MVLATWSPEEQPRMGRGALQGDGNLLKFYTRTQQTTSCFSGQLDSDWLSSLMSCLGLKEMLSGCCQHI